LQANVDIKHAMNYF